MATGSAGERSQAREGDGGDLFDQFDPGTNVLVSGPPLVGKYDLMLDALAAGNRDGGGSIVVSTRDDERAVLNDLRRIDSGFDLSRVGIVECMTDEGDDGTGDHEGEASVHRAGSPADLTGIGIGASELMSGLHADGVEGLRVGVDSLSTLLLYTEFDRMARFLHVFSGRIDRAGGLGIFVINPGTIEDSQFDQLKTLFDGLVELREEDDRREVRVRGIPGVDSGWRPYSTPEFD
jgi:KaiC/GvpD/RAD55 family RecA-like ATPase